MFHQFRSVLFAAVVGFVVLPLPCEAYVQWVKVPLTAHRGHAGGKGMVTFTESFGETSQDDGAKIVIDISNVPLPPGTELVVEVHEKEVGTVKLDSKRGGRLVLESKFGKSVPRIHTGSTVTISLPGGGGTVLW